MVFGVLKIMNRYSDRNSCPSSVIDVPMEKIVGRINMTFSRVKKDVQYHLKYKQQEDIIRRVYKKNKLKRVILRVSVLYPASN